MKMIREEKWKIVNWYRWQGLWFALVLDDIKHSLLFKQRSKRTIKKTITWQRWITLDIMWTFFYFVETSPHCSYNASVDSSCCLVIDVKEQWRRQYDSKTTKQMHIESKRFLLIVRLPVLPFANGSKKDKELPVRSGVVHILFHRTTNYTLFSKKKTSEQGFNNQRYSVFVPLCRQWSMQYWRVQ